MEREGDFLLDPKHRKSWQILEWHGPERLSAEWWDEGGFHRDYYRVLTETGEQLWIFSTGPKHQSRLYLQGYFD